MGAFIYFNVIWLVAGFLTGLTAFGSNLFAVPMITLVMPPRDSILFGSLAGSAIFLGIFVVYIRHVLWREAIIVTLSAFAGIPIGIWFLANAGARALLLAAGFSLSLFLAWQCAVRFLRKNERPVGIAWGLPLGLVSGIMMSAVSFGGPPLALYAFLRQWDRDQTLGSINAISVGIMLLALPWLWQKEFFTGDLPLLGLYGSLAALVGIALSIPVAHRIKTGIFRILLLATLALSAAMLVWRGLMA